MDSYRYLNRITRMAVKAWIKREPCREIPWTPLRKPLARSTLALISSAAGAMRDDRPFDQDKELRDPWHPDESANPNLTLPSPGDLLANKRHSPVTFSRKHRIESEHVCCRPG